jgi:hypothetical protein
MGALEIAGGIVLEGIKLFSAERQRAIMSEHKEAITHLQNVHNRNYRSSPQYTDIDIKLAEQKLMAFVAAYAPVINLEIGKIVQAGIWPQK